MTDAPPDPELSEQQQLRRDKRARMLAAGQPPYPVSVPRSHSLAQVRELWGHLAPGERTEDEVAVVGRVVHVRNTGKLCFATLQEGVGTRLQVMLSLAEVGPEALAQWKELVDLGDHVGVEGTVVASKRGELSVLAHRWHMASKALRPLPVLHRQLNDETRVRQRYADLLVRQEARDMVRAKAGVVRAVRRALEDRGFLEVETPILQLVHGGAAARPFRTHLHAFDQEMTLRIALELALKKAVVGGVDRVYEIGRVFRNEGIDATHSAEFTMLEAYQAYGDLRTVADLTRDLVLAAADAFGSRQVETPAGTIDLDAPWRWLSVYDAVSAALGSEVSPQTPRSELVPLAQARGVPVRPDGDAGRAVLDVLGHLVEPTLVQPTFLVDYPAMAQPLARPHRERPGIVEAWDLIIGGVERATGFSELIDPVVQRDVLVAQSVKAAAGDEEAMQLDDDFLRALEYGAPPMGGMGMGMDRLVMLFTNAPLRDTVLFPLLKPES